MPSGAKSNSEGYYKAGRTSSDTSLYFEFETDREGYHQLSAKVIEASQPATQAYIKVEYAAPAVSDKF